eukprot:14645541-Alexandrium_andersonii.AAC.1
MSASLVGSEMCIRDSARSGPDAATAEARRFNWGGGGAPEATTIGLPVSYTHLTLPTICSV